VLTVGVSSVLIKKFEINFYTTIKNDTYYYENVIILTYLQENDK